MQDEFNPALYYSLVRYLKNYFRTFCEVELQIGLVTRDEILIDVHLVNRGAEPFGFVIDWVPEMAIYVWQDGKEILPIKYVEANSNDIALVIEPGESHTLKFAGVFSDGDLVFPKQCIFENVGSDFEIAYSFLRKSSDRIRIRIPN